MTGADLLTSAPRTFVSKVYAERPFALHGLEGISDAQIEEHLALYAGYVKQVNLLNEELAARLTNHWVTLHHEGVPVGFKPLLIMDVWEHAFVRDHKATERGKYIEAFFRNIDWKVVEGRLD